MQYFISRWVTEKFYYSIIKHSNNAFINFSSMSSICNTMRVQTCITNITDWHMYLPDHQKGKVSSQVFPVLITATLCFAFSFYQLSRVFQAFFTVASLVAVMTLPTQQVQKSMGVLQYLSARFGVLPPGTFLGSGPCQCELTSKQRWMEAMGEVLPPARRLGSSHKMTGNVVLLPLLQLFTFLKRGKLWSFTA